MTIAAQHTVTPEDIMALIDGEPPAAEAQAVAAHVEGCAECTALADQFRATAQTLAAWTIPSAPHSLDSAIREKSAQRVKKRAVTNLSLTLLPSGAWRQYAIGGGCAVAALILFAIFFGNSLLRTLPSAPMAPESQNAGTAQQGIAARMQQQSAVPPPGVNHAELAPLQTDSFSTAQTTSGPLALNSITASAVAPNGPMIARIVGLVIQVKDIGKARPALDAMLARYQGYAAELNINTPENALRTVGASLRIPAPALSAALGELRSLGRVQTESQSGEEVTAQHADLVARLNNARETEQRLRAILLQRTGKVEEILQVEEQISNTRGEIERMEAEQKSLEHRVDFATVQLQLIEEFKAQFAPPSKSVVTRMRNAFVEGLENAGSSLLGILLFFEQYGPVLLVWMAALGAPTWFFWRRYRRAINRI